MRETVSREKVLELLESVEHPEIACSLMELGMLLDVTVKEHIAHVAISLPTLNIPVAVRNMIENRIAEVLETVKLELLPEYFEMPPETRTEFFMKARANWKGPV